MVSDLHVTSVSGDESTLPGGDAACVQEPAAPDGPERAAWLLLIYTVPSEPSRLRAAVWRDLKKAGAVYLRDGVAVLPDRPPTRVTFREVVAKIDEFGGQATLVADARLDDERSAALIAQAKTAREEEYREIAQEAERFLAHVAREREHRDLTFAEVEEIEEDLGKLRRWADQVRARDYFGAVDASGLDGALARCETALASFLDAAYRHGEGART
jgi:hypothetical protein